MSQEAISPNSQNKTAFWNVAFLKNQELDSEFCGSANSGLFLDESWQVDPLQKQTRAYFQLSSRLTDLKKMALAEKSFAGTNFGIDPYSLGLWQSQLFRGAPEVEAISECAGQGQCFFRLSGQAYKMAGADDFQELAILLASVFQLLEDYHGLIGAEELFSVLSFELTLTPHLFKSLAKVRSFQQLLVRIIELLEDKSLSVPPTFCAPSVRHLGSREPWTNILRLTSMQAASLISGSQGFVNLPYDLFSKKQGGRISRNSLEILSRESFLDKTHWPSMGSSVNQKEVSEISERAWQLFTEILKKGGLDTCLRSGWIQQEVARCHEQELGDFLSRRNLMTGINQYSLAESLSSKFPLVAENEKVDLESWWNSHIATSDAVKKCDVERMIPVSLAYFFEQWQYRGDQLRKVNPLKMKIPVLLESSTGLEKKWKLTQSLLGLAGFQLQEQSIESLNSDPLIVVMAMDPDGEFSKKALEAVHSLPESRAIWAGDKSIAGFDFNIGESMSLQEVFAYVFDALEGH